MAKKFPLDIISVDSVMVYKDCDIGSAKPDKKILRNYPHELVNVVTPNKIFTVGDFYKISKKLIKKAHSSNKIPFFVGGSMMYFRSLYHGIHDLPSRDTNYREELLRLKLANNDNYLYEMLEVIDPNYAKQINENDEVRIIRALEIYKVSGKTLSDTLKEQDAEILTDKYYVKQFGIYAEKDLLDIRIKDRIHNMIDKGLKEEALILLKKYNIKLNHPLMKSVNYKQIFEHIAGNYSLDTFIEKSFFATRQLAKRQRTWIKSWNQFHSIKLNDQKVIENNLKNIISFL